MTHHMSTRLVLLCLKNSMRVSLLIGTPYAPSRNSHSLPSVPAPPNSCASEVHQIFLLTETHINQNKTLINEKRDTQKRPSDETPPHTAKSCSTQCNTHCTTLQHAPKIPHDNCLKVSFVSFFDIDTYMYVHMYIYIYIYIYPYTHEWSDRLV